MLESSAPTLQHTFENRAHGKKKSNARKIAAHRAKYLAHAVLRSKPKGERAKANYRSETASPPLNPPPISPLLTSALKRGV
jgi:hypothetical protein